MDGMSAYTAQDYVHSWPIDEVIPVSPRMPIIVAAASVQDKEEVESSTPAKVRSHKWKIDESEVLHSTTEHRLWTFGSMALMGSILAQGLSQVSGTGDALAVTGALAASYILSDLGTGIYHWSVDNYGGPDTPFFGRQIAAFQGHHRKPWTITEREFCNNVHQVFRPAAFPAALFLLLSPFTGAAWNAFIGSFLFLVCMSQQFHAWSHMKKSELPSAIVAMQDAGLLISRKAHGAHHRSPFGDNYCIVSGLWNPLLDNSGFFKVLEDFVLARTGVEPRCWHPPADDWAEMERPAAPTA